MTVEMLRAFFGWCTLLNWGLMIFSLLMILAFRGWAFRIHSRLFGIQEEEVKKSLYMMMAWYKLATFCFCAVPYLALRIIA